MRRPLFGRTMFALLVVVVLAACYAVATTHHGPAQVPVARVGRIVREPVSTAVRACAAPGTAGPTAGAVAIAAVPGSATAGSAVVTRLTPSGSAAPGPLVATATKPGVLQVTAVPAAPALTKAQQAGRPGSSPDVTTQPARGGVVVNATGAMAQGLEVEQTGASGLVTAQCGTPGTDFWFVGPGQAAAPSIELYLMNSGNQPAVVAVSALTDITKSQPVLGNPDSGISVPPHGMVSQQLGGLLQGSKVMALNVTTSSGQVVAAVRESQTPGGSGAWLAPTMPPVNHQIIAGLPKTGASRQLYLAVPGTATAQVKISAITARGTYQPTGGTGVDLLGGSATTIPLPALGGVAGSVEISSNVPLVAAMLVPGGPSGAGVDLVSAPPVREQGVLADNPARSAGSTQLVLSAPARAASVRITTATSTATAASQPGSVVQIAKGTSVLVPVSPPSGTKAAQFAVIITPLGGSGPVYAGRIVSTGGTVQSVLPVPSSPTWLPLPAVLAALPN